MEMVVVGVGPCLYLSIYLSIHLHNESWRVYLWDDRTQSGHKWVYFEDQRSMCCPLTQPLATQQSSWVDEGHETKKDMIARARTMLLNKWLSTRIRDWKWLSSYLHESLTCKKKFAGKWSQVIEKGIREKWKKSEKSNRERYSRKNMRKVLEGISLIIDKPNLSTT